MLDLVLVTLPTADHVLSAHVHKLLVTISYGLHAHHRARMFALSA